MLFPKQACLQWKTAAGQFRVGRVEFADGSEPAPKNATLAALKTTRINMRLIGHFGWTHVGRSFDGMLYSKTRANGQFTFLGAIPTRGVFQTDGWGWNQAAQHGRREPQHVFPGPAHAPAIRAFPVLQQDEPPRYLRRVDAALPRPFVDFERVPWPVTGQPQRPLVRGPIDNRSAVTGESVGHQRRYSDQSGRWAERLLRARPGLGGNADVLSERPLRQPRLCRADV